MLEFVWDEVASYGWITMAEAATEAAVETTIFAEGMLISENILIVGLHSSEKQQLVFHGSIPPSRTGGGATKEAPPRVDNGSGDFSLVIKSSSRPQKKATTHHRKKGPRKTKLWDIRRGPADTVVEASFPPMPLSAMTASFPDLPSSENGYEGEGEDGEDER
ncbi:hypothetical protein RJ640_019514 [Escallonia rubra]|uniref:Uncharacterized protein n=1 Tax=Escallonia rubra TaxID=112253 RepID=A0AA88U5S6_9ASTE|nr:hypothetical protein RJ640_019514 [Escallonia rubra]